MESLKDSVAKLDQLKLAGIISEAEHGNLKRELIDSFISAPTDRGERGPAALNARVSPYTSPAAWPVYRVLPSQGMVLEQPTVSGWYSNDKNVKVQPLPEDTTEDDLRAVFGTFGEITSVALKGGYAYVNFKTRQAARAAVAAPKQSIQIGGTPVLVTPEKPKGMYGSPMLAYAGYPGGYDVDLGYGLQKRKGRSPKGPPIPKHERRVLLVTFLELTGAPPTHEQLYEYCCPYGTVVRISLVSKPDREQALVQFADPDAAQAALDGLNQYSLGFCKLDVQWGRHAELTFKTNDDRNRDFQQYPPGQPPPPKWQQLESARQGQQPSL